jgi:hypothetical protein
MFCFTDQLLKNIVTKLWLSIGSAASPDLGSVSLPAHSAAREIALRQLQYKTYQPGRTDLISRDRAPHVESTRKVACFG